MESWNMQSERSRGMVWAREVDDGMGGFQFMDNTTASVINSLKFDVARQVRSMIIILAGFNVAMALVLAIIIFRNAYKAIRKSDPAFGFRYIETSEVFPFVLAIGIIIQGIIYAASQIKGLEGLLILGCTSISQAMFPALFVVPFIQLVFGLESTVQALRRKPFQQRPRWVIVACLLMVIVGLLALYVQTRFRRPPDLCYASLFWFVQRWRLECFALLTIIGCALAIGAIVVFVRLHRDASIGIIERTAASKMVYYMVLGAVLNGLMAPFFFSISAQNPLALANIQLSLSMVGSVASNVSGITFGVLYLFLRCRKMQKIGPLGHVELGSPRREKSMESWRETKIFNIQMDQPVSPVNVYTRRSMSILGAGRETAKPTTGTGDSPAAAHTKSPNSGDVADDSNPAIVFPTQAVTRARKDSYSLFPNQREALDSKPKGATLLPSTTYTPDAPMDKERMSPANEMFEELLPPPAIRVSGPPRHNRESSLVSSATVQIGLRVSNLEDAARLQNSIYLSPKRPSSPIRPGSSSSDVAQAEQFLSAASSRRSSVATSIGGRASTHSSTRASVDVKSDEKSMMLAPAVYNPGNFETFHDSHRRSMDSIPSTPGAQSTDGKYSVGTADWI